VPENVPVLLVGDSEFGAVPVIRQLEKWQWDYVLRQKANHQVKLAGSHTWQRLGNLVYQPGQSIWLGLALRMLIQSTCCSTGKWAKMSPPSSVCVEMTGHKSPAGQGDPMGLFCPTYFTDFLWAARVKATA